MLRRSPLVLAALLAVASAAAQPVVFNEGDGTAGYYGASDGQATGGDVLELAGPDGRRLPLTDRAQRGTVGGQITARHGSGSWQLDVGAPGFAALDFSAADSLVLWLNGPVDVPGVRLPSVSLVDGAGRETARLPLDFNTLVGFNRSESGFLPGTTTDARFRIRYVSSLPESQPRPGYPETILVTFADTVVTTSTPSIGIPGLPAKFSVATASGTPLTFRFVDTDGDGTLSTPDDYIDVLLPEDEGGSPRPTWRIDTNLATPSVPPGEGDTYRLAVFNSGIDGDPETWQRRAVALADFGPLGDFERGAVRSVRFTNPTNSFASATASSTVWFDAVEGVAGTGAASGPAAPTAISAETGNGTVLLRWTPAPDAAGVLVYRRDGPDAAFRLLTADRVTQPYYADLSAVNGETYTYVLRSVAGSGSSAVQGPDSAPTEAGAVAGVRDPYLDLTERLAFDYFWTEANPANGLVRDRSRPGSAASIAAVGFGLSAYTVGVDRGYISRAQGVERTLATLRFFESCPQSDAPAGVCGYRGFFYHFLNMQTGERAGTNELSTIDTALLLGGVLHAARYYDGDGGDEAEIRQLADTIWRRTEWDWSRNGGTTVSLGWNPESGFISFRWVGYNEAMLLYVLALGSPTHPVTEAAWDAWTAGYDFETHYGYQFIRFPPLFGHQYSHIYIDFRGMQDDYTRARGLTYFENSRRATLANRAYCIANPGNHPGYGPNEWGLTASDDPFGYRAHGAPPAQSDNGTITPTAAGGSFPFTPAESRDALRHFYEAYRPRLWGPYGLKDAFNVRENWVATDYLGIDQGPILLMIENERTGAVWNRFMTHPDVQTGLDRAGFEASTVASEDDAEAPDLALSAPAPNPARGPVSMSYSLAAPGPARLDVFDALGRLVGTLAEGEHAAGEHPVSWDASAVSTGVYVVRLEAGGRRVSRRVVVVR